MTRRRIVIEIDSAFGFDYEKPFDMLGNTVNLAIPRGVVESVNVDTAKGIEEITVRATHGITVAVVADPGNPPPNPVPGP